MSTCAEKSGYCCLHHFLGVWVCAFLHMCFTSKVRAFEWLVLQVRLRSWERRRGRRGDRWTDEVGIQSQYRVTQQRYSVSN